MYPPMGINPVYDVTDPYSLQPSPLWAGGSGRSSGGDFDTDVCISEDTSKNAPKPANGKPAPSPNFVPPANPPQVPPKELPPGHSVRVMPPTEQYPNGYWVQTNEYGQPVDPVTGKPPGNVTRPVGRSRTHVPLPQPKEGQ
jgi:hypothetical protein